MRTPIKETDQDAKLLDANIAEEELYAFLHTIIMRKQVFYPVKALK